MQNVAFPGVDTDGGLTFLWDYLMGHKLPRSSNDDNARRFLAHCLAGFPLSKAQLFQDLYVAYKLVDKRNGFFVEFGATNGVDLSNTCYLERVLGWNGILAEPMPTWHAELHANRRAAIDHRCVWWESGKNLDFVAAGKCPELSAIAEFADGDYNAGERAVGAKTINVATVSLNDLLTDHGAPSLIDYLSVDTEGSELDILCAFDFDRFKVRIITVEHNYRDDIRAVMHQLLTANGYVREFERFSRFDDWYFHPDRI